MVTKETVEYVARLARIAITEAQKEYLTSQLSKILDYIDKLKQLDTADVEPLRGLYQQRNVWRADSAVAHPAREAILKNAPSSQDGYFKIPKVIE